ncbi:Protein of unknown function [Bacillus cereus]|nr:Protein of unknown function [Bacillus cereus]
MHIIQNGYKVNLY